MELRLNLNGKNKNIVIVLFVFTCLSCLSQNKFQVKYNMLTLFDGPKNYDATLTFSDTNSCFEYQLTAKDTSRTEFQDENNVLHVSIPDKKTHLLYINLKKRTISEVKNIGDLETKTLVKDSLDFPNWSISQETKTISNHLCYKAITDFKGRKYEAWFTLDYPIKYGPWKLNGLPGLIIEVHDSRNEIYFEAKEIVTTDIEIKKEPKSLPVISTSEYNDKLRKKFEDLERLINATGDRNMKTKMKFQINDGFEITNKE